MTTYYVDPAAAGDNDGGGDGADRNNPTQSANWTDAWVSLQSAMNDAVAGDTVYCRGTQTISTNPLNTDAVGSGDCTTGPIKFIGCDANGNARAAQFTLQGDAASKPANLIAWTESFSRIIWENFTWNGANVTDHVFNIPNTANKTWRFHFFTKCIFTGGPATGFMNQRGNNFTFRFCVFSNNTVRGMYVYQSSSGHKFMFCRFESNGQQGITGDSTSCGEFFGCIFRNNGYDGLYDSSGGAANSKGSALINCIADNNTRNGFANGGTYGMVSFSVTGCRITNQDSATYYGIDVTSKNAGYNYEDYNVFDNNTADRNNIPVGANSLAAADTTEQGYVDQANADLNLTKDAILRSTAIDLNWDS